MLCAKCLSVNQAEFTAEINVHFRGRRNIDDPGVLIFPKISVCLDCGSSRFFIPETELPHLAQCTLKRDPSTASGVDAIFRRKNIIGM